MSQFHYVVTNTEGQRYTGTMVSTDIETAMRSLVEKDLVVARIQPIAQRKALLRRVRDAVGLPPRSPLSSEGLIAFTQQLIAMLESGVTMKQALDVMIDDAEDQEIRQLMVDMSSKVGAGMSVTSVLATHPQVFSRQYVATVGAGESGGDLVGALRVMAGLLEKSEALRRKVASALYYPAFILVMAGVFLTVMLVLIVPRYAAFYQTMGGELPLATRAVMGVGSFVQAHIVALVLLAAAIFVLVRRICRSEQVRLVLDDLALRLPVVGQLFRLLGIARFSRTLASLLSSGVMLMEAIELVVDTMGNAAMERGMKRVSAQLMEGRSIVETLRFTGMFTRMSLSMISVGEQSGQLDRMLAKVADYYEDRVDHAVRAMASLVEPLVIVLVGVVVAVMVVGLVLPVFNLVTLFVK